MKLVTRKKKKKERRRKTEIKRTHTNHCKKGKAAGIDIVSAVDAVTS